MSGYYNKITVFPLIIAPSASTYFKGPFPLSDCDCESEVASNWVLVISMELFTSSDMKHQRKISRSQSLSGNGLLGVALIKNIKTDLILQINVLQENRVNTIKKQLLQYNFMFSVSFIRLCCRKWGKYEYLVIYFALPKRRGAIIRGGVIFRRIQY